MNGVLVIDKPAWLSSHDVVVAARRVTGERRIGHTGTLDPLATGVLPLACGAATRLVRFLSSSDKDYEATIRFGLTTDSYDVTGNEVTRSGLEPRAGDVERALESLRGEYQQTPPLYSAKKIGGRRAYELARRNEQVELKSVPVRVTRADLLAFSGATATVAITCSAGFYVRSFAHTLGDLTGAGACLEALRRTRSGEFGLAHAVRLEDIRESAAATLTLVTPLEHLLSEFPWAKLSNEGVRRVSHGQEVRLEDVLGRDLDPPERPIRGASGSEEWVRMLDGQGRLIAVGTRGKTPGSLHPSVVLI